MGQTKQTDQLQGTLFEDDYLLRSLGTISYRPDLSLTELVANAWDAGAGEVRVTIPAKHGEELRIEDDGCGMTPEQFKQRWMMLGYNRLRHQGVGAEFPPERQQWHRRAYGRNGMGRHGLLCFGSRYAVESWRDGHGARFVVATSSGQHPFIIEVETPLARDGHGTCLVSIAERNLCEPDRIRDILAARFLHDPQFRVTVNGRSVPLWEHSGLLEERELSIDAGRVARAFFVDTTKAGRTTQYQGVAFWVGGRLVGEPSWIVGGEPLIDGRTRVAKRYTAIVSSDDLFEEVLPDWSAFRPTDLTARFFAITAAYVREVLGRLSVERVEETRLAVERDHADELRSLQPLARFEVRQFIESITTAQPQALPETISAAVKAVISLERTRTGRALLEKLAQLTEEDVAGLDRLLGEWSVRDALTVLDEIDNRLVVLEAIRKLSIDTTADELHVLHPLVTAARWLFGPEFDSPEYTANISLTLAVRKLFGDRVVADAFLNERRRPDIIVLGDATLSAVATDHIDEETGLATLKDVLVIEIKRGGSAISRDDVNQATGYVEDLLGSGLLESGTHVRAFVVGHQAAKMTERVRKIGDPERGSVHVATYGQLVRTGERRLFSLRERLTDRYEQLSGLDLATQALSGETAQLSFGGDVSAA